MRRDAEAEVRARIAARGRIPFAEFADVALYHPVGGYYAGRAPTPSQEGDYFTSPMAHPAFGALLAMQSARMWELLDQPRRFFVVEMGAGSGALARDFLAFVSGGPPRFRDALRYVAIDRRTVPDLPRGVPLRPARIAAAGVPLRGVVGCLLSNELVDAFPFHRFRVQDGRAMEVYVSLEGNEFVEVLDTPSTLEVVARLRGLPGLLSEGHEGEVNLGIAPWMQEVANALQRGFVVTIDYGHEAADLYAAARSRGSTHAYYRHTTPGNLYRRIGRQDITAHVDFTAVARAGEARGLRRVGLLSQAEFLGRLGLGEMLKGLRAMGLARAEYAANRMAMLELVDAEGLGGFKVMVQERGTGITDLEQVVTPGRAGRELAAEGSRVPLAGRDHLPLSRGRYPHTAWEAAHPWTA